MADKDIQVIFKEAVTVKDHKGNVEFSAQAGEKVKLNPASAERWIRRDKATDNLKFKSNEDELKKEAEAKTDAENDNKSGDDK